MFFPQDPVTLYVGNLSRPTTARPLTKLFALHTGCEDKAGIVMDLPPGIQYVFAYVSFNNSNDAHEAMVKMD